MKRVSKVLRIIIHNLGCLVFIGGVIANTWAAENTSSKAWRAPKVSDIISQNILYFPIMHKAVKKISIQECKEELIDLLEVDNPRIRALSSLDQRYPNTYVGYSKVRQGVYEKLVGMLKILPSNIGIAYFEGFRPLSKQKEYFDNKLREILTKIPDKELAYQETAKHVSPFIDNIPTHSTGAAIDITLFEMNDSEEKLLDMGKFDVITGPNNQQETFSNNTTMVQRENRLMLLNAAAKSGLVNYGYEWWHFSYGDKVWAFVKGEKHAIYGIAAEKGDPILLINKETYLKDF